MFNRRSLIAFLLFLTPAFAADKAFFDKDDFEKAQARGDRILVEVAAPWCPACKVQAPIIEKLTSLPENKGLIVFMVDYDTQKDELKYLKAQKQSTLIMFKGKAETARSAGDTSETGISKLFKSSL